MSRLRPSPTPTPLPLSTTTRPLRVVAAGTLFLTHALSLPTHPGPGQTVRAHEYSSSRGGSAPAVLSVLSQLNADKCWLVASLGGAQEARAVARELEAEGVSTRYCKVWEGAGVPAAWVLQTSGSNSPSVINHNPLPDIPHEEFVSLLGPLLAPEHYPSPELPLASPPLSPPPLSPNISAPFDWIHFEGRSVKTTLSNLQGLDGLARERRWRAQCVFSVDVGRRAKQGIEALIPHADVLFLNRHYAQAQSPAYASAPRAFLLALTRLAPPHALLVAYWGAEGAAALSVPTREYFQSSGWTGPPTPTAAASSSASSISPSYNATPSTARQRHHHLHHHHHHHNGVEEAQSVRTGSGFWAAGHDSSHGSSAFSAMQVRQLSGSGSAEPSGLSSSACASGSAEPSGLSSSACASGSAEPHANDSGDDSDGTEIAAGSSHEGGSRVVQGASSSAGARGQQSGQGQQQQQQQQQQQHQQQQQQGQQGPGQQTQQTQAQGAEDVGSQDAFIAGMIYALSRRLLPGAPYAPGLSGGSTTEAQRSEGGRWKLDECLRFATELAGRRARRQTWDGLGEEMARAGWFDG